MEIYRTGWIGLGKMGVPMSQNLLKAGYPVTVYNRDTTKENSMISLGASSAKSPKELMNKCDIIFMMVSDDAAITEIFTSENGLLKAETKERIIINMSTVSPVISTKMAVLCAEQGHCYLDAPVSGSIKQAEDGTLVIMVGGDNATFEKAKPVLEKIGRLVMRVGDSGAGNKAKLVINSLLGIFALGLAEAAVSANQLGLKIDDLVTLINNSALSSPFLKIKGEAIVTGNYKAAFALKHIVKDLGLAKDLRLEGKLADVSYQAFQEAEPILGDEDIISVVKHLNSSQQSNKSQNN